MDVTSSAKTKLRCHKCNDIGMVAIRSRDGAYAFAGPVPDDAAGYTDADCWYCDSGPPPSGPADRDKTIEVMAEAIADADTAYASMTDIAEATLAALHANGLAVVPVEPTREMMIAGLQSMTQRTIHSGRPEIIYRAMLSASNSTKEESDE